MLSFVMLSVVILSIVMLSVIMLSVYYTGCHGTLPRQLLKFNEILTNPVSHFGAKILTDCFAKTSEENDPIPLPFCLVCSTVIRTKLI
jgi:hypothetical protein